jgi:hypothetical protein
MNSYPDYFCIVERIKQRMRLTKVNWLIIATLLLTSAGLSGQVMYPGDVNNSGQANTLDVLFLGLSWGSTGPERMSPTTAWMPQSVAPNQWAQEFSNGINYAYADCNGDGVIDQADLEEGIEANFLLEHGGIRLMMCTLREAPKARAPVSPRWATRMCSLASTL